MSVDRLPSLPLPLPSQAYSSGTSSPRLSSIASSNGSHAGSLSSYTSAASSNGPKTPSPTLPINAITGPPTTIVSYDAMNQAADMYYPQHMSAGQAPPPQTVTSGTMTHYQHHQPTLLQPGPAQYSNAAQYPQYGYANGLTSPPAAPPVSNMGQPQNVLPLPGVPGQQNMGNQYAGFDTSGQQPPPGMKPRVTATLWEDEGSLCFQVEARGICVARREDNHMINGTKLLNVAGMTRGRRDGILKSEKVRHVVKIGPMHLKGVWIPYERALDFANKEKITEMLYPLFVHNIGALLYHPTNQSRTTQVMAAAERRKQEQGQMRNPPPGLPSIGQHHHHSMALPGPQTSLPSQNNMTRPPLDRAHTFPTPPTSASSVMGAMGPSEGFNWQGQGMNGTQATTPPGNSMSSMQPYSSAAQGYDGSRQLYTAPASQQSPYQSTTNGAQDRLYAQPGSYPKSEMAPPSNRAAAGGHPGDQHDSKPPNGIMSSEQGAQHQTADDEPDHEHDPEYTHDSGAYDASRTSYNYTAPGVGSLVNDGNMPSDMTGSPSHPPASGRATPRTAAPHQPYYPQHPGYSTPPRIQSSSNLYNVMTNDRAPANGAPGGDVYAPQPDMTNSMANGYAAQAPVMNGSGGMKRGREDDDDLRSNDGPGGMGLDLKRRKTMMETSVPAPAYDALNRPASAVAGPPRR
ncbi:hypothetical protein JDV02_006794 [Purpureocillium takamizusanense]|uniref:HTH APSES-type domain-containing protein n=1 Tax=Purpureocillium takamizusanense TaxID=2060973 RepID=A0A9Q8QL23_9HYPO|nr:uncharacterized protein JDV02_006794 [Purpureocillium takamizusanense]UNI20729.1 hypothetical protein JDV02_006794 [Purpureocillium takamizusanense]